MKKFKTSTVLFLVAAVLVFAVIEILIMVGILNAFWNTIIRIGAVMAIVSLGLNLIYGFNGQFSLGQWGFYAIGAYTSALVTYRWTQINSASGLTLVFMVVLFAGAAILLVRKVVNSLRGLDALSAFALYMGVVLMASLLAVWIGNLVAEPVTQIFSMLPEKIGLTVIYFLSVLLGGLFAAEICFLFGLPVLTLGSDYFGIATLGFTIIVKVLLDNSDTLLGFEEMKGARGMIGIPKVTSWFWVFAFLLITVIVVRNLLNSSYGRAIVSIREDETAATAMGIDVAYYKIITFVIGSLLAGLAGGLYAHINGFLHPNTFSFIKSFDPLIIVVFGGLGSVTGTVFASFGWALVLEGFLRLVLPQGFETWRFVVYPLLLLIMMLLKPAGLFGDYEIPFIRAVIPPLKKKKETQPAEEVA